MQIILLQEAWSWQVCVLFFLFFKNGLVMKCPPNSHLFSIVLGNQYADAGNLVMAVKYFTDAIKHNPKEYK